MAAASPCLAADERERLTELADPSRRVQHAVGRALIRLAAASACRCAPASVVVEVAAGGKPRVVGAHAPHVSVAHVEGLVVVAASREATVGVDVERLTTSPDPTAVIDRVFAASEAELLASVPSGDLADWFTRAWTIKEAVGKALGAGIGPALAGVVCRRDGAGGLELARVWAGPPAERWTLHQLAAPEGEERIAVALPVPRVALDDLTCWALPGFSRACARADTSSAP